MPDSDIESNLVLIVEDDPFQAEVFEQAMKMIGFHPTIAGNGRDAKTLLHELKPRLLILDLSLPEVSGEDILRYLRAEPALAQTKVIVASAAPQVGFDTDELADFVMLKPVDVMHLQRLAERLFS